MKRILWYSDYGKNCMTGYATVSRNIIKQLKDHFGDKIFIQVVAINYFDEAYAEYDGTVHVVSARFGPIGKTDPKVFFEGDDFGRSHVAWFYHNEQWDAVFMLQDVSILALVVPLMKKSDEEKKSDYLEKKLIIKKLDQRPVQLQLKEPVDEGYRKMYEKPYKKPFTICYFPIDGPLEVQGINKEYEKDKKHIFLSESDKKIYGNQVHYIESLCYFDMPVTFTNFAHDQVISQALPLAKKILKEKLQVIYHGTNTTDFCPLPADEKLKFRQQYFGKNAGRTIIGVINRNQPRKDIPTAIYSFQEAKRTWPAELPLPFLYLHMHASDPQGWHLPRLLQQRGLIEGVDYMFSKGDENGQVPIDQLNRIYNSLDMYLSTAVGGGWELTVTEAMACKVPCILPEHSSLQELGDYGGRACMVDEFVPFCMPSDSIDRLMCHFLTTAELIQEILKEESKHITEPRVEKAFQWVQELEWKNICRQWIEIFEANIDFKTEK